LDSGLLQEDDAPDRDQGDRPVGEVAQPLQPPERSAQGCG
jgi:hypothetical protein